MNDSIQNWKDSTWQIRPSLNVPELDPEVVQLAILDSDPVEDYRTSVMRNETRFHKEVMVEKDPRRQESQRRAHMTGMWDLLFRRTTGDQVYLLAPSQSKRNSSLARAFLISSNAAPGRKWLATKVAYRGDAPLCWSIPVDTVIGKSLEVELCNENALDLSKLYDDVVGTA